MTSQALASRQTTGTGMTRAARIGVLRADALFLLIASGWGFCSDIAGSFYGAGPVARMIADAPHAAIGLTEAHGLAFILGVLLWRADSLRQWHIVGGAIHLLLGSANLAFWQIFVASDMLALGYVTTSLHWFFVALHVAAILALAHRHSSA